MEVQHRVLFWSHLVVLVTMTVGYMGHVHNIDDSVVPLLVVAAGIPLWYGGTYSLLQYKPLTNDA